jgi:hypothetical protein
MELLVVIYLYLCLVSLSCILLKGQWLYPQHSYNHRINEVHREAQYYNTYRSLYFYMGYQRFYENV